MVLADEEDIRLEDDDTHTDEEAIRPDDEDILTDEDIRTYGDDIHL